jgi:hypothetical protein
VGGGHILADGQNYGTILFGKFSQKLIGYALGGGTVADTTYGVNSILRFEDPDLIVANRYLSKFTNASTSGTVYGLKVDPTYNQTSGTAANTDLLINRTETAIGSGDQLLADFQRSGTSQLNVDRLGRVRSLGQLNTFAKATAASFSHAGGSFITVPLGTEVNDAGGNYNNSTYIYTVPVTGWYMAVGKFRLPDSGAAYSVGLGIHTSNADGTWVQWGLGVSNRNGLLNTIVAYYTAGDQVRMFAFIDTGGSTTVTNAELTIYMLSKG